MQITETNSEGLKREFHITVPAGELSDKVTERLDEIGRSVRIPGFRPGKVPMRILRQRFGSAVLGEVLQSTVEGSSTEAIREHNLRPALPPKFDVVSFSEGADLEYKMSLELLPEIPQTSFADLAIERLAVEIPEEEVDQAVTRLAEQQRQSEPVARAAASGDIVVIDVEGRIDDREIPGAAGTDRQVVLGSGTLIPGFEDQLVGAEAGEERTVRVPFPADYAAADLAGKEGVFTVKVKEVRQLLPPAIDDALAQAVGLETLAELRTEMKQSLQRNYDLAARLRLKRALLDKLAERADFPVPPGMVDLEFENIWEQYQAAREREGAQGGEAPEETAASAATGETAQGGLAAGEAAAETTDAGEVAAETTDGGESAAAPAPGEPAEDTAAASDGSESEEALKAEYRQIAERRIRLGLLLADIGRSNNITVSQEELNQALAQEARRHPGHERQVIDYYRQNPGALANLRAPILEDKVIDFIVEMAKPEVRRLTPQELLALPEPDSAEPPPA
ncbi:MAG: trigger factor [Stellaceae bacterium]